MALSGRASLAGRFAAFIVRLRHVIVLVWILGAAAATALLPALGEASADALGSLVPKDAPAIKTEIRSAQLFRVPVLTSTAVVQRDPGGLSAEAQARVFLRALRINRRRYPDLLSVVFALPVTNAFRFVPGSSESSTTAITYLYMESGASLTDRRKLGHWFSERRIVASDDALVGVTGVAPARVEQGKLIQDALPIVRLATVLLIGLVIGFSFRALGAPIMTLAGVGVSYLVAVRLVGAIGSEFGTSVPRELEPIMLVLLLGIVTDYSIFYLSGFRVRLLEGDERLAAARSTTAQFSTIIVVAGLLVAAGAASLASAKLEFFRIFGPSLALTVLVGLAVSVTFVPALLALLGRAVYWPSNPASAGADGVGRLPRQKRQPRVARLVASKARSGALVAACVLVLLALASGLGWARLAPTPIETLPESSEAKQAAEAAAKGFAPGIISPTLVLLEQPGISRRRDALARLQSSIERQPGIAAVIGPRQFPTRFPRGAVLARSGNAVRLVVILENEPFGSQAIRHLKDLRSRLPGLLSAAGLAGASFGLAGNTALAEETIATVRSDIVRIALAVLLVNLLFLAVFLRALIAPVYLLGASILALMAALGLTTYVFQGFLGHGELTYYIPFLAAVLLVSLGSDYNVFLVGRIWQEARERPLAEAIAVAVPRASRAINIAGVALALSFALLAIVPLSSFREFAFAMIVGVALDAFLVRSYLVPGLVSLFGELGGWPGRRRPRGGLETPLE
jgi:RND superfamily putative drug exporter